MTKSSIRIRTACRSLYTTRGQKKSETLSGSRLIAELCEWARHHTTLFLPLYDFILSQHMAVTSHQAVAGIFGPANLWECLLEGEQGVQNDTVANHVAAECTDRFPNQSDIPPSKKSTGIFSAPRAGDCVVKNGKTTSSPRAVELIQAACYELYRP
jgi:hypothetical protein